MINPEGYITEDSGERQLYETGMRRDSQEGKPRYDLLDRGYLCRWALLMARGASKYGERNWELAETREELDRFVSSSLRHHFQWIEQLYNTLDKKGFITYEDHAVAVSFNIAAAEKVKWKLLSADAF